MRPGSPSERANRARQQQVGEPVGDRRAGEAGVIEVLAAVAQVGQGVAGVRAGRTEHKLDLPAVAPGVGLRGHQDKPTLRPRDERVGLHVLAGRGLPLIFPRVLSCRCCIQHYNHNEIGD